MNSSPAASPARYALVIVTLQMSKIFVSSIIQIFDMNTASLKIDLINKITQLKESYVIEEINRILDFESDKGIFKLTSKQKDRILEKKFHLR